MHRKLVTLSLVLLAVAACASGGTTGTTAGSESSSSSPPLTKPAVTLPATAPATLQVTDLIVGTGATATIGSHVTVQYVGVSFTTKQQFDASWDRNAPIDFVLGKGDVIKGWDQGLAGMKVGGRRQLVIPPSLGYGADGRPPTIPPNDTLVFVVDLVAVR